MIKGFFIWACFVGVATSAIAVSMAVPLDTALGVFSIGLLGVLSLLVPIIAWRARPRRKPQSKPAGSVEWTYLSNDPVCAPLPPPLPQYYIEGPPAPRQIEAPGRELVKHS